MRTNTLHQTIVNENDFIDVLYRGNSISSIIVSDTAWISQYTHFCTLFEIDNSIQWNTESNVSENEYIDACLNNWHLPAEYEAFDIYSFLVEQCTTPEQTNRVLLEWNEFKKRNMITVLKFLKYFVDTLENNNVLWGVGRGSSVASYILYLLKVHRVDSLKYELDIKEFLK